MRTNYHTDQRPAYECSSRADRLTTPTCRSVAAATVDEAVAEVLLDALTPEQVALALAAAGEVAGRHQRVSRAAELAVERARYDADRALRVLVARDVTGWVLGEVTGPGDGVQLAGAHPG